MLLLALIVVVFGVAVGAMTVVVALLGRGSTAGISLFLVASQVIGSLLTTAVYPLLTNTLLLLTYDLRVRREGYDVEAMADALGTAC